MGHRLIGAKLGITFTSLAALLGLVAWLSLGHMARHHAISEQIVQEHSETVRLSNEALDYSNLNNRLIFQVFLTKDPESVEELLKRRAENSAKISARLGELDKMVGSREEGELFAAVTEARRAYTESYQRYVTIAQMGNYEGGRQGILKETLPLLLKYHAAWNRFIEFQQEDLRRGIRENDAEYASAGRWALGLIGLATLVAAMIAVFVTREVLAEVDRGELIALRGSEEKYRSLVRNLPDVVWSVDEDYRVVFISPNIEQFLGYTAEEMYAGGARVWLESLHPDDSARVSQAFDAMFTRGEAYDVECRVRRKDGTWIWAHDRSAGTYDRCGKRCADGVATDITERKRADEELRSKTALLEAQVNSTIDGILVVDAKGQQVLSNQRFVEIWGIPPQVLADKDDSKALQHAARMVKDPKGFLEKVAYLYGHPNEISHDEVEFNNGTTVDRYSSPVKDESGACYGRIFSFRDITRRKRAENALRESEAQFRQLTETIREVFFVLDPEPLQVLYVSPAYEAIWRRPRKELYADAAEWMNSVHPDDSERAAKSLDATREGVPTQAEFRLLHSDGSSRWIRSRTFPVNDENGKFYRIVGIAEDITEQRNLEEQLRQTQKLEAIGQLAAGIAHEINTPIQFVSDNLTFLRDAWSSANQLLAVYQDVIKDVAQPYLSQEVRKTVTEEEEKADLEYVGAEIPRAIEQGLEGVQRVAKIVRAMKEFSHPDSAEKTATDLNKAIETTITVARNEWKYVAEVATDFDASLRAVPCYVGQINQVILNLLVNAAHAIKDKVKQGEKGLITVSTRMHGEFAEIALSDTGSGIPEAVRSRIFDPFFTTKGVGKGTGQGLALAHSVIVRKHAGKIWFETEVGKGTTFYIQIPLEVAAKESKSASCGA